MTAAQQAGLPACAAGLSPGLVPSINKWETTDPLKIDKLQARCTRLRKNLGVAARHLSQSGAQAYMLTLTYRGIDDYQPRHVSDCLMHLRKWAKGHGYKLQYLWVMELQKRGAPHYHLVLWLPRSVGALLMPRQGDTSGCVDSRGWWPHGFTNIVEAVAPVRYVMKYVSKFDSSDSFPKGARCYGIGGLTETGARIRRWINWPTFVQARSDINGNWARATGGGWLDRNTGEVWPSEWAISVNTRTTTLLTRVYQHPTLIDDVKGPFSWIH